MSIDEHVSHVSEINGIPGWFYPVDRKVFEHLLGWQNAMEHKGDLLELGTFVGKTAILLGFLLKDGETLTVCDLFGESTTDADNQAEVQAFYRINPGENAPEPMRAVYDRMRDTFEQNFLRFHTALPRIVQGPTSRIRDHVAPGSCRFVHIDASHLFNNVREDIAAARDLLGEDGLVALDDFRKEVTPGVAAAAWEAVAVHGLRPVCLTNNKLYATWGDPEPARRALLEWARPLPGHLTLVQRIKDDDVVVLVDKEAMVGSPAETGAR